MSEPSVSVIEIVVAGPQGPIGIPSPFPLIDGGEAGSEIVADIDGGNA